MAVNKEELMETIENMTVLELSELVSALEERFGVARAAVAAAPAAAPASDGAAGGAAGRMSRAPARAQSGRRRRGADRVTRHPPGPWREDDPGNLFGPRPRIP